MNPEAVAPSLPASMRLPPERAVGSTPFQNHARDGIAIKHQGLRLAPLPGWKPGHNRADVGNGLPIAQHAHVFACRNDVEILLGVLAHFGEYRLFHGNLDNGDLGRSM